MNDPIMALEMIQQTQRNLGDVKAVIDNLNGARLIKGIDYSVNPPVEVVIGEERPTAQDIMLKQLAVIVYNTNKVLEALVSDLMDEMEVREKEEAAVE